MPDSTSDIVKALIQTQILAAFNEGPELIEKLIKAALEKPVDRLSGRTDGYSADRVPYIDYLIGQEIREAARVSVKTLVKENLTAVNKAVQNGLQTETITHAITKAITGTVENDWQVNVKFEIAKDR